jgi:hypothetical protein
MIQRDGILALAAYAISALSFGLLFIGGKAAIAAVEALIGMADRLLG